MKPMQEKFQTTAPARPESDAGWVSPTSIKRPQEHLCLPGEMIEEPTMSGMPLSVAGKTDVSNEGLSQRAMKKGYAKNPMGMTDDLYTGEHADQFYGDAGGFCERNNYLDRA